MLSQFAAVWTFFTRLPAPAASPANQAALARGAWAFPLVGAVIGALGGGAFWLAAWIGLPPWVAATLALALMIVVTGGLHEDGLADLADGFGGGRTREHKLAIMRDSRIGAFGALALIMTLLLRAGALAAMTPAAALAALIASAALGRAAATVPLAALPPARDDGLGHDAGRVPVSLMLAAWALAVLVSAGVVSALHAGALPHFWALAIIPAVAVAAALSVAALARSQIGGVTGDVAGAAIVAAETAALLGCAAAFPG